MSLPINFCKVIGPLCDLLRFENAYKLRVCTFICITLTHMQRAKADCVDANFCNDSCKPIIERQSGTQSVTNCIFTKWCPNEPLKGNLTYLFFVGPKNSNYWRNQRRKNQRRRRRRDFEQMIPKWNNNEFLSLKERRIYLINMQTYAFEGR